MNKLVCFKHPHYVGNESPALSCKACCSIFITQIKAQNNAKVEEVTAAAKPTFDAKQWLEEKIQEARQAAVKKQNTAVRSSSELV